MAPAEEQDAPRKVGRKKGRTHDEMVSVRISAVLYDALCREASQQRVKLSDVIRARLLPCITKIDSVA